MFEKWRETRRDRIKNPPEATATHTLTYEQLKGQLSSSLKSINTLLQASQNSKERGSLKEIGGQRSADLLWILTLPMTLPIDDIQMEQQMLTLFEKRQEIDAAKRKGTTYPPLRATLPLYRAMLSEVDTALVYQVKQMEAIQHTPSRYTHKYLEEIFFTNGNLTTDFLWLRALEEADFSEKIIVAAWTKKQQQIRRRS